ncbi:MAG TPA: caspase family protein, partial [Panacibacter sp.]|nr:caspase family protein [Panacibacter sp.]
MLYRFVLLLLLSAQVYFTASAQSVYHLQYNFNTASDTVTYHAFLVRYNDGSGFVRLRFKAPAAVNDAVVEMTADEQYLTNNAGIEDTGTLVLKMQDPKFIAGDSNLPYTIPVFIFSINPSGGYFEPRGVTANETNAEILPGTFFDAVLLEQSALKKSFVSQYFNKNEDLFINLATGKSRGDFVLTGDEKKIKMHLIIVADVLDSSIGSSCQLDMERTLETFDSLRKYMGFAKSNFITKTIAGKDLSKKNVQAAIANLKPSKNDIVIFYYSGHGYRLPENGRRFPNIKLKTFHTDRQDVLNNSMNMEDIFNSIKNKGARLNLVLSDCCNDDIFSENAQGSAPAKSRGSNVDWSDNNVRTLFLNKQPLSVLATAAQGGQRASGNNKFGGFFSFYFKTAMEN